MNSNLLRAGAAAGLLLVSGVGAAANTVLTFNVDMANAAFDPNTQTVSANGTFNGWAAFPLTNNPTGPNPTVWSGTTNIPDNGILLQYKYVIQPAGTWENVFEGNNHNRLATLPSTSGASLVLPLVFFGDSTPSPVTDSVTFRVNMAQQINTGAFIEGTSSVYARGIYNGWASDFPMTNDPSILTTNQFGLVNSNVYVYTYDITGSPGQTMDFKYWIDTGNNWESPTPGTGDPSDNNNRFFALEAGPLPIIYFNDAPYAPIATNLVKFQVDMSSQWELGKFDALTNTVEVRGNFNSWGGQQIICTNDPTAVNTNIFSAVVQITDGVGAGEQYKFWYNNTSPANNSGWENGNNRTFQIVNGPTLTLPLVNFDNVYVDPTDVLQADTVVTFQVSMTNAVGTDGHVFQPTQGDIVYINGVPTFGTWGPLLPAMTNNPVPSQIYSVDLLLPRGSYVQQTYKYGINAADDEAPAGTNHIRYVRSTGTYVMPLDVFGHAVVEQSFGNLTVSPPRGGYVLLSWLGRPGVHLQTSSSLAPGAWVDHLETDGMSLTNWPISGSSLFFRLIKP